MKRNLNRPSVFQPEDESIKFIPLTRGQIVTVDAADYEWLNQRNWHAIFITANSTFYAATKSSSGDRKDLMHRVILGLEFGDKREGDHINRNTLDCTRKNLRIDDSGKNAVNRRMDRRNTSGYKGVWWHSIGRKWAASVSVGDKTKHLGLFTNKEEAYAAYCKAATEYHGEFANL